MTAHEIIELLGLEPHREGGYFAETYRAELTLPGGVLPPDYSGERSAGTAIYYLLTPDSFSAMHRVRSDEIFHFYIGDPVQMLQLHPDGSGEVIQLGHDLAAGMRPQVVVPGGVWQGSRLEAGGHYALLGATVAPGFEYADFELAGRQELVAAYPDFARLIEDLTR